jgi:hypothetical protein
MEISNGINNATLFIPFISDDYCNSEACREEFSLVKKKEKTNVTNNVAKRLVKWY